MDKDLQKWLNAIVADCAPKIRTSAAFASIVSKSYLEDPSCALQMGLAIFMDKPIFLIVGNDEKIPERLERIADKIVRVDFSRQEDMASASAKLVEYINSLDDRKSSDH